VCAAAWLTPDASAIIAGDAAATSVMASRARIFAFMSFPAKSIGPMEYESRVLNTHQRSFRVRKSGIRNSTGRTFNPRLSLVDPQKAIRAD
jgi:hypothetical protein